MKYILKKFHPLTEKVPKCKISFPPDFETQSLLEKYLPPENVESSPRNEKEN